METPDSQNETKDADSGSDLESLDIQVKVVAKDNPRLWPKIWRSRLGRYIKGIAAKAQAKGYDAGFKDGKAAQLGALVLGDNAKLAGERVKLMRRIQELEGVLAGLYERHQQEAARQKMAEEAKRLVDENGRPLV